MHNGVLNNEYITSYTVRRTLYVVYCTPYTVCRTMYDVHYTPYISTTSCHTINRLKSLFVKIMYIIFWLTTRAVHCTVHHTARVVRQNIMYMQCTVLYGGQYTPRTRYIINLRIIELLIRAYAVDRIHH